MKKILMVVAMLAAFATSAFAQGVNFGVNISYQSEGMLGDNADKFADDQTSSGFAAGLSALVPFTPMISLHTGLDFQINTYSYTWKSGSKEYDEADLFLNLQLPLLARFNFTPGFFAEAGFDMQFNLLATHYDEALDEIDEDAWNDWKDWSFFGFGPSIGLGYTMWFGLEFSGRLTYGVIAAYDEKNVLGESMTLHPLRFQIDIAYWFGYKK